MAANPASAKHPINKKVTPVTAVPYEAHHKELWDAFVKRSMNGTVFHLQQFLAYHAPDKFKLLHIMFYEGDRLVAVLPGGLKENGRVFESPLGASYGGFVTEDINTQTALSIVSAFEAFIEEHGIEEVYLTSAPVIYPPILTQNLDFSLLYKKYFYQRHYISHAIDLQRPNPPFEYFQATARKHIRRVTREFPSVAIEHVPQAELERGLQEFYPVLLDNKAKYNAKPTHTLEELLQLNALLPDLMQLFLVKDEGKTVAGSLLFIANDRVALVFYHMLLYAFDHLKPIYLLMNAVTQWAYENKFAFVDIGVSQDTSDDNPMTPALSLIEFKEKFNSRGVLRSTLHKQYRSE